MPEMKSFLKDNYVFGLDIGTRSVVGIVGYQTTGSFIVVADYVYEHDTRAMMDGQIHDVAKVSQTIKVVKHELEKQVGFTLEKVCIAAAGRVLKTKTVHVDQEVDPNTAVTEDRVFAIELLGIEKAHQEINQSLMASESGFHCVGYTVSKYYLNDYEITHLVGHKGKKIGADVLATFLPKEVVESLYQVVGSAGLSVHSLTLEPIAAINIAIPKQFRLLNIALIDIGAGTSDIAITKEGSIIAYGMIPLAGDELTEAIVHHFLVDFQTAETIKIKASGKTKTISYKDIMGISHKVTKEEVEAVLEPVARNLAQKIAEKIVELNSGNSTNAVFIVGGGGQLTHFPSYLAMYLNISEERVALRGKTVLDTVEFESGRKKTPEMVTPIGICVSGLDNKHDFVQVFLNDEPVKVFDTNHLTVMDIAAFKGYNPKDLIASRGDSLAYYLNGLEQTLKGGVGEPSQILVNNKPVSLNDHVVMNDYITIIPARKGKNARLSTYQLLEQMNPLTVHINGTKYTIKPSLLCNGQPLIINYDIQNHDKIETVSPSIKAVFTHHDIPYHGEVVMMNGIEVHLDTTIMDNDYILLGAKEEPSVATAAEGKTNLAEEMVDETLTISVMVNGKRITLKGKKSYVFVDIFDYYQFDLSKPQGIIVCEINDQKATYMEEIHHNDVLKIFWSHEIK